MWINVSVVSRWPGRHLSQWFEPLSQSHIEQTDSSQITCNQHDWPILSEGIKQLMEQDAVPAEPLFLDNCTHSKRDLSCVIEIVC